MMMQAENLASLDKFQWQELAPNTFVCRARICKEEDNRFTAYATRLPGVASQGDTFDDAVNNIVDAFTETLKSYLELGVDIPWELDPDVPENGFLISKSVKITAD